jgi:hypothetical protein
MPQSLLGVHKRQLSSSLELRKWRLGVVDLKLSRRQATGLLQEPPKKREAVLVNKSSGRPKQASHAGNKRHFASQSI